MRLLALLREGTHRRKHSLTVRTRISSFSLALVLAFVLRGVQAREPAASVTKASSGKPARAPEEKNRGRVVETIFRQPEIGPNGIDACVIGDVSPVSERFHVRLANMGADAVAGKPSWDAGRYTGLRADAGEPLASHTRGPRQAAEGTAVQVRGRQIGIWIDSEHPRPRQGALLPICPGVWWLDDSRAPRPFREANGELSFSFDLKVPTARREGKAEVYICAYFLFGDQRSHRQFWLGPSLFDLRGADRFRDIVHIDNWEAGTGLPILLTALNKRSAWLHPGNGSAEFTDRTFNDYRHFDFRVGFKEFQAAVAAVKKRFPKLSDVSEDPRDYRILHFNLNPEVYAPAGSRGRLGLAVREICVARLPPVPAEGVGRSEAADRHDPGFNDYLEESAVWTTDTSKLDDTREKWTNGGGKLIPSMYWDMTKEYVGTLRKQAVAK
jgi:hypothetical protein